MLIYGVAQPKAGKPHPSSLRRTGLYVSLLGISVALYLSVFEQPARVKFLCIPPTAQSLLKAFQRTDSSERTAAI
jgi:hypothetical protein